MALNIRIPEVEKLTADLARETRESKIEAVTKTLRDRLVRVQLKRTKRSLADELEQIAEHYASLPVFDGRRAEEILGCDESLAR